MSFWFRMFCVLHREFRTLSESRSQDSQMTIPTKRILLGYVHVIGQIRKLYDNTVEAWMTMESPSASSSHRAIFQSRSKSSNVGSLVESQDAREEMHASLSMCRKDVCVISLIPQKAVGGAINVLSYMTRS